MVIFKIFSICRLYFRNDDTGVKGAIVGWTAIIEGMVNNMLNLVNNGLNNNTISNGLEDNTINNGL